MVAYLQRPKHTWEYNIKMDAREIVCEVGDWIEVAQNRVQYWAFVIMVMSLRAT
jgi:hypothetical protein